VSYHVLIIIIIIIIIVENRSSRRRGTDENSYNSKYRFRRLIFNTSYAIRVHAAAKYCIHAEDCFLYGLFCVTIFTSFFFFRLLLPELLGAFHHQFICLFNFVYRLTSSLNVFSKKSSTIVLYGPVSHTSYRLHYNTHAVLTRNYGWPYQYTNNIPGTWVLNPGSFPPTGELRI